MKIIDQTIQPSTINDSKNDFNENLRSISAVVAARQNRKKSNKLSESRASSRLSTSSKESVNVIDSTKDLLKLNNSKAKTTLWRSSRVIPYNNNVFYFDDSSDLAMTDVLSNRDDRIEKRQQNIKKRKCRCIAMYISLFTILLISIIITVVLVAILIPSGTKPTQTSILLTNTDETIYGIWNTTVGSNSNQATVGTGGVGTYYTNEIPDYAFDKNSSSKYTSYGSCNYTTTLECGKNTGVYLTLKRGSSLLVSFRFLTAIGVSDSDPLTMVIEGSNQSVSSLVFGSSWSLIYSGTTGLDNDPGRGKYGETIMIQSNTISYCSYRIIITSKRNIYNSVQYSEIELFGY